MTSKAYWQSHDFDFAETFSLLRGPAGNAFFTDLQEKARKEQDTNKRKELLSLSIRGSVDLLCREGIFHPTAVKTNVFARKSHQLEQLSHILQTDFTAQSLWMCGHIFRDAILFYKSGKIASCLHICLTCDWIETDGDLAVDTDDTVFPKLRAFFQSIGHPLE